MMKPRHLLKLAKKASLWTTKTIELDGNSYTMDLYTYGNASGFVHFARLTRGIYYIADAKNQYYNRTWERFTGESTYRSALNFAVASGDITEEQKTKIMEVLN